MHAFKKLTLGGIMALSIMGGCTDLGELPPGTQQLQVGTIDFGVSTIDITKVLTLEIGNAGPGILRGAMSIENDSSLSFTLVGSPEYNVEVDSTGTFLISFTPTVAGRLGARLILESDNNSGVDTIALTGEGTAALLAAMSLSPTSLDFGSLPPGQDSSRTLVISSTGASPLEITGISVSGSVFTFPTFSYPLTIDSGQDTSLMISFAPSAIGDFAEILTLTTNTPDSPEELALTGRQAELVSYGASVQPVFDANCAIAGCHNATTKQASLVLDSFSNLMVGSQSGAVVVPGDGANSLLVRKLKGTAPGKRMPLNKPPLPDVTITLIEIWIDQGALNN